MLAAQPRLGAMLTALGVVDHHLSFDSLGLETFFVDDEAPAEVTALRGASRVVCWFGARDPVFARHLGKAVPGAILASPAGDQTAPVWAHLLRTVGAAGDQWRAPLTVPVPLVTAGRAALAHAGWDGQAPLAIVHPGSGSPGKRWPVEGFARVLDALRATRRVAIVLHEGPADHDAVAALTARLGGGVGVVRGLPLNDLAGALAHASAYLGNDSGVSHLAAAVGVPSVILFESARLAWLPWGTRVQPVVVTPSSLATAEIVAVRDRLAAVVRQVH